MPNRHIRIAVLALATLLACAPAGRAEADGGVVATIHPIASIARFLTADSIPVRTLLPPGAHPDTYEPTPRLAEAVAGARLIVRVGGAVDDWLEGAGGPEVVLTEGLTLLEDRPHGQAAGHAHGAGNPHVWLDPILVRDALLPRLADALVEAVPAGGAALRLRAAAYADSLTALDAEIRTLLAAAPRRRFVAVHPAWPYFADRYGLEQVGVLHPSPGEEIGARELAELVDEARRRGVGAAIAEPQLGRAGLDAIAGELSVRVEIADALGGEGIEGRDSYLSLMRFNARAFARALGAAP